MERGGQTGGESSRWSRRRYLIKMRVHILGRGRGGGCATGVLLQQISYLIHPWHSVSPR
jgi:hypothetical protein